MPEYNHTLIMIYSTAQPGSALETLGNVAIYYPTGYQMGTFVHASMDGYGYKLRIIILSERRSDQSNHIHS